MGGDLSARHGPIINDRLFGYNGNFQCALALVVMKHGVLALTFPTNRSSLAFRRVVFCSGTPEGGRCRATVDRERSNYPLRCAVPVSSVWQLS